MQTILVVDDSAMIQALYRQVLGRSKTYSVRSACNGQEALSTIAKEGEPALILLDVNMPVMDGLAFLEHANESGLPDRVPVIIASTEGEEHDVERGLAAGARAYLKKPFRPQELLSLVETTLSAHAQEATRP